MFTQLFILTCFTSVAYETTTLRGKSVLVGGLSRIPVTFIGWLYMVIVFPVAVFQSPKYFPAVDLVSRTVFGSVISFSGFPLNIGKSNILKNWGSAKKTLFSLNFFWDG